MQGGIGSVQVLPMQPLQVYIIRPNHNIAVYKGSALPKIGNGFGQSFKVQTFSHLFLYTLYQMFLVVK